MVTSPAVPPARYCTAAASACSAAEPVTGFSASSCAALPCAGRPSGVPTAVGALEVAVALDEPELAASAIAARRRPKPPRR
jgi:hypothetical protein